MQVRLRFDPVAGNPLRRSRASRARNAGEIAFWPGRARDPLRRSCVSRARNVGEIAFWIGRASLLEEVWHETLVLETWRFTFGGSLVRNVLGTWRFTFGGSLVRNARFGDLALHLWSWTQTWPVCSANVVRERAVRSWTQKWPVCSTNVVREKAFRRWTQTWPQFVVQM